MFRRSRPALLILFVLLQLVAPLLHAHPGASRHGGLHLPPVLVADGHDARAQASDPSVWHEVVSVLNSLEARESVYPVARALPMYQVLDHAGAMRLRRLARADPGLPPLLASSRLPLPIAPPGA